VDEERHRRHDDEHHGGQRVDAQGPVGDDLAGGEPIANHDMGIRAPRDHDESDPSEDTANPEKARRDVLRAARADPGPENARDQKTEKRQEND
jgi:hypothetical protein